jgi:hypothetical protein
LTIVLYNNLSETHTVNKQLTELVTLTGTLREESSIIDPVITVVGIDAYLSTANYAYIPEFHRYYFINDVESVRNGVWRLTFHVDVLYTYRDQIKANSAIISRNQVEYDLKLNDGLFQTQQNPRIAQFPFPSGFNTWNYVLAIAGN